MSKLLTAVLCAALYSRLAAGIPLGDTSVSIVSSVSTSLSEAATSTSDAAAKPSPTVPYASDDPNYWLWNETTTTDPEPVRGSLGGSILGPQNIPLDKQNPDLLAPPTTDNGDV